MPESSPIAGPGDMITLALRLFGGLLIFMGAIASLSVIGLITGDFADNIGGVVAGVAMLAAGIALLKLSKRVGPGLDEKLTGLRRNPETGALEPVDPNSEVFVEEFRDRDGRTVTRTVVRPRSTDDEGQPTDSNQVRKTHRFDAEERLICGRGRSTIPVVLGLVVWIIAFFYSGGYGALFAGGEFEFDLINLGLTAVGLVLVIAGGLTQEVVIDKRGGEVLRDWSWFFLRFPRTYPLGRFDHVVLHRSTHQVTEQRGSMTSRRTEVRYEVRLAGDENLYVASFGDIFDARGLAAKISEHTGFEMKEDL